MRPCALLVLGLQVTLLGCGNAAQTSPVSDAGSPDSTLRDGPAASEDEGASDVAVPDDCANPTGCYPGYACPDGGCCERAVLRPGGDVAGGLCTSWKLVCGTNGICSANCDHLGQPCCIDRNCVDGGICMTYSGYSATACIAGSACGEDAGVCTTCGAPGLPCCDDGGCVDSIGECDPSGICPIINKR